MDIGTLLSVVQTLSTALQCSQLKEVWSIWGYKSDLDELSSVVSTVKTVLLDAEAKHDQLSQETLLYIEELRDALYDADDLLDEFITLAKQRQLMKGEKFIEKIRLSFSRYNKLGVAYNMSQRVKKIMKKLDGIVSKHTKFGLKLDYKPMKRRRDETCSYPDTQIIGRDEDLEKVVGILLDRDVQRDVSVLTIVGMGGLGKTALAQLVYNNEKISKEFPMRLWTCVSDHDQSKLDVKIVLTQILEVATGQKHDGHSFEMVVDQLRKVLAGNRYLIVLDDLWSECRDDWQKLAGYLLGGQQGSQIVVTTRSKETAKIVGNGLMYELNGLSDENSWGLFQLIAFEQVLEPAKLNGYFDFINMGKAIVKKCANVPLAIRVIGGLLYGQDKSKWMSVKEFGLANLREDQNGITPILKLSYHNLEPPLRSCFSYCSLYPKDFEIEKEKMISFWIAQGYVVPLEKGQSIEDASEEYFMILLRRCFFQNVFKNDFGEILSFKLHDLMHDVALEVAGKEILPSSSFTSDIPGMDKMVRHVSLVKRQCANHCFAKAHIRTYLHVDTYGELEDGLTATILVLSNFKYPRTLDLSCFNMETLSSTIGKLIHLRYLNLSHNNMEVLPNSFTKLYNLQTLLLNSCNRLKELPKDFCKLVNLRVLKLVCCDSLTFMPSGMDKLTDLCTLSKFVVGEGNVELEGLKALKKLRGFIEIEIRSPKRLTFVENNIVREGSYIRDKEHLNRICFKCKNEESNGSADYEEELLGTLQPHVNLKDLRLVGYRGVRMPRWAKDEIFASFLPNLVRLDLDNCSELQCLPSLGNLQYLKYLRLHDLPNLDYVECHPGTDIVHDGLKVEGLRFFPCLERLSLKYLPKLKEWWAISGKRVRCQSGDSSISSSDELHQLSFSFPRLINLEIWGCPELTSIPHCPNIEKLSFFKFNARLRILSVSTSCPRLREVTIDNIAWLHSSLPMDSFKSLTFLKLSHDKDVESLDEFGQVFRACSFSLRTLEIWRCTKLRSVFGGLGYLGNLESLSLSFLPIVNLADEGFDGEDVGDGMPWGSLSDTLCYLQVTYCKDVQSFPKWMRKLTALRQLYFRGCSERLYERCQNPYGEDWPNIQHIPIISIK